MPLWGLAYDRTGSFTLPLAVAGVVVLLVAAALHAALVSVPPGGQRDTNGMAAGPAPSDRFARG